VPMSQHGRFNLRRVTRDTSQSPSIEALECLIDNALQSANLDAYCSSNTDLTQPEQPQLALVAGDRRFRDPDSPACFK